MADENSHGDTDTRAHLRTPPEGFESPVTSTQPSSGRGLTLTDRSSATKRLVRADEDGEVARHLAVRFGASRRSGDAVVCGQRPGEWLVVGPPDDVDGVIDGLDTGGHVSVVNHTHSRAMFRLTGMEATSALEKICGLDWSDAMTPDGAVVSASVAKTGCDLIRSDLDGVPSYLILCDRSFGQYLFDAVLDAGDEFGIGVSG